MVRSEFDALWSLPDKCVNEDIVFIPHRSIPSVFVFEDVEVIHTSFDGLFINGTYHCKVGSIVYNFTLAGTGAITRYCLGSTEHGDSGRFHQHLIRTEDCVRRQLPFAIQRDDFRGLTALQAWNKLCGESGIAHVGMFFEPELMCK
jgi:hypothetical protein